MLKFRSYKIGESRRGKIILGHKKTLILLKDNIYVSENNKLTQYNSDVGGRWQ